MILDLRQNVCLNPEVFETLKKISFNKGGDFNQLIGEISEILFDKLDWCVELPASRNTLQSPLFYHFCCIHLIIELMHSGTTIKKVIVDSSELFKLIKKLKEKEGHRFEIDGPDYELPSFKYYIWKSLGSISEMWKKKRLQFKAAMKTKNLATGPPRSDLILIDQFVFPNFITKERYYNGLWDKLSQEQKQITYFVPTLVMMRDDEFEPAYNKLRTSERNFLIKEDYLTFSDLLFSLLHLFRVWFIKPPSKEVMGFNFSPLIREELLSNGVNESALEGLLNYRFAKRLKEKSFNLSLVIDWWEGQPLDKGWNLGFHTYFPDTLRKGYIGYAPRAMELQLRPSESEIQYGVAPATIATIGEKFSCEMNYTDQPFRTETAPAFRFGHLWDNGVASKNSFEDYRILMALTTMVDESVNILEQVIDSELVENKELKFILKPHPTVQLDILKNCLGDKWSPRIQEGGNTTPEEIRKSDLLITGMSSVGLEAVVMGVPVIVVETLSGLAHDPIPESVPNELWRSCRSPEEISEAVDAFMNRSVEEVREHQELSASIKNDYFEPVTRKGVQRFLKL